MNTLKENLKMQLSKNETPLFERLIAIGSYMTFGTVGMIYLLLNYFVIKRPASRFLTTNIIQSFILSILYAIFSLLYGIFMPILVSIPLVGKILLFIHNFLFETPIYFSWSFINFIIVLFLIYLSLFALFAKLPYIPFVTDISKEIFK